MKGFLFVGLVLLLASQAQAGQCPASPEGDPCRMVWSPEYGGCIVVDEKSCTKDDLLDVGSEVLRAKIAEFQVALETANVAAMPPQTRKPVKNWAGVR